MTTAQVLLRWALQKGVCIIPKASAMSRITANSQLDGFVLDADQVCVHSNFAVSLVSHRIHAVLQTDTCMGVGVHESSRGDQMGALDALAADPPDAGRLCWKTDPMRLLDFE